MPFRKIHTLMLIILLSSNVFASHYRFQTALQNNTNKNIELYYSISDNSDSNIVGINCNVYNREFDYDTEWNKASYLDPYSGKVSFYRTIKAHHTIYCLYQFNNLNSSSGDSDKVVFQILKWTKNKDYTNNPFVIGKFNIYVKDRDNKILSAKPDDSYTTFKVSSSKDSICQGKFLNMGAMCGALRQIGMVLLGSSVPGIDAVSIGLGSYNTYLLGDNKWKLTFTNSPGSSCDVSLDDDGEPSSAVCTGGVAYHISGSRIAFFCQDSNSTTHCLWVDKTQENLSEFYDYVYQ